MVVGASSGTDSIVKKTSVSILIADNSVKDRSAIKEILEYSCGKVRIIETDNGVDAVKLFMENKPELVIIDLNTPRANGIESLQAILKINKMARVILLATKGNMDFLSARKLGARDCIFKPLDRVVVNNIVSKILYQSW